MNSLSTNSILSINNHTTQLSNWNTTSTSIFNNLISLSTNSILSISNLNTTSTTLFNKTNFTNLLVSGTSTCLSSLNVVGSIIGSGSAPGGGGSARNETEVWAESSDQFNYFLNHYKPL